MYYLCLEEHPDIDASVEGKALLSKTLLGQRAIHQEGVVLRASDVASPDIHIKLTEVESKVSTQGSIELLVLFVVSLPVGLALALDISTNRDAMKHIILYIEVIVSICTELMLRNEGHELILVVNGLIALASRDAVRIFLEGGTCVTIGGCP